ncbi:class I SAM-dependent methyltransferase [Rothia sp. AR01]|uniref:Class I SAM-dependent methyltransferase n=1 Tax=Rothia santali TaxID=2949643 RepID=A0A9X2HGT2_9MICC|nr:class I SAM-dependent methyltransferase [Rothia santali]MCP3425446.1 class I SAM-dependent methyltransferase [Rothia santali]
MREPSLWELQVQKNPGHSRWYIERFEAMRSSGADLHGEARMVDAMLGRASRVLDAGAGTGRVGGELAARGHEVTGVDVDPELVEQARADHPGSTWIAGDLAELPRLLPADLRGGFDAVVCAGNVMTFLAPSTRRAVLAGFAAALKPGGRAAVGFGAGRGYPFEEFLDDVAASPLDLDLTLSSWDLRPFEASSGFLVALLAKPENPAHAAGERTALL